MRMQKTGSGFKGMMATAVALGAALATIAANVNVQVAAGQEAYGKVSGGKAGATKGTTLTLKATAAKGYGFAGWFDGSTRVSWHSSWKYTVENANKTFTARFVAARADKLKLTNLKPYGYKFADLYDNPVPAEFMKLESNSEATLTISGIPPGIKAFYGLYPEVNGGVDFSAVNGRKPGVFYVTISAKNANGFTQSVTQKWILGDVDSSDGDFDDIGIGFIGNMDAWHGYSSAQAFSPGVTKISASGLPPGVKLSYSGYTAVFKGYPSKPGKYTVNFTATIAGNASKKARKTIIVSDPGSLYFSVISASPSSYGEVKGSGVYKVGAKVSLLAKPANGYLFAGWFIDSGCTKPLISLLGSTTTASGEYRKASDSLTLYGEVVDEVQTIYAKFIPKSGDYIALNTDLGSSDYWETGSMEFNTSGASDCLDYYVLSGTLPTVTAKKLPPGFTLDAKSNCIRMDRAKIKPGTVYEGVQLTAKNLSGMTATKEFPVYVGHYESNLTPWLNEDPDFYYVMVGQNIVVSEINEDLSYAVSDGADWKVSASGLPSGVKFNYNGSNIELSGVPTKAGAYVVVFTFTRGTGAEKETRKSSFTLNVYDIENSPFVGTFTGFTCWNKWDDESGEQLYDDIRPESRAVTITSAKNGKVTAKVGKMSFSGTGWINDGGDWRITLSSGRVREGTTNSVYRMCVAHNGPTASGQIDMCGYFLHEATVGGETVFYGIAEHDSNFAVRRNRFGQKSFADGLLAQVLAQTGTTMYLDSESAGYYSPYTGAMYWLIPTPGNTKAPFKMTLDKKGVVKVSGKFNGASFSASTTLLVECNFDDPNDYFSLYGFMPVKAGSRNLLLNVEFCCPWEEDDEDYLYVGHPTFRLHVKDPE